MDKNKLTILYKENNNINFLNIYLEIHNQNNFYKYKYIIKNIIQKKKLLYEYIDKNIPTKIYIIYKQQVNKKEYENKYNIIIKFNDLFKSFMKKKYNNKEINNYYLDISYNKDNNYYINFYMIVSHEFGIFKNRNNIKILIKEFNEKLKKKGFLNNNDNINFTIYDKELHRNIYSYYNRKISIININDKFINETYKSYNIDIFLKTFIGYYDDINKVNILDSNINTLDNYFKKI